MAGVQCGLFIWPANVLSQLQVVWSQAFLNKDYLHTYKYKENVIDMTIVRFCGHFVTFFLYQTIQLCDYILFCVCVYVKITCCWCC